MMNKLAKLGQLLPLLIFFLMGIYLWKGLALNPHELPSTLTDKAAPKFAAQALNDSHKIITEHIFMGHLSLLHVWATWCSVCQAEHPYLVELAQQEKIRIIGLNYKDQRQSALQWLAHANPYTEVIYDKTGRIGMDWGVYGTPETFMVDQKGIVRYKYTGQLTQRVWETQFLPRLKSLQATTSD